MVPADDARLTLEFPDHYLIQPSISFNEPPDFSRNATGEHARPVHGEFEYNSGTNEWFLSVPEIRDLVTRAE
jgi:UDP-N-acetylglucosamine 4,6-dehydratase